MDLIAVVRQAEPWTGASIAWAIALLGVVGCALFWLIRRYLRS